MATSIPLADRQCIAYGPDARSLTVSEIDELHPQVSGWTIFDEDGIPRLSRSFKFRNFVEALTFTNAVAGLAEELGHHPTLITEWGRVTVQWWTHAVRGLHLNDFIAAAKSDRLHQSL